MRNLIKKENGLAIVEATFLLPLSFIIIIALYYVSIFLCQKANLQANLQTALIYYKNIESDSFVMAKEEMQLTNAESEVSAEGSGYEISGKLFPYRFFTMKMTEDNFESMFDSICGYMFFDTGENVKVTVDTDNFIVYKKITAVAEQEVKPAVSLAMVGVPDSMTIAATGEVVIYNGDEFIRNTDFIIDVASETAAGEKVIQVLDKVSEYYGKFKEILGMG